MNVFVLRSGVEIMTFSKLSLKGESDNSDVNEILRFIYIKFYWIKCFCFKDLHNNNNKNK